MPGPRVYTIAEVKELVPRLITTFEKVEAIKTLRKFPSFRDQVGLKPDSDPLSPIRGWFRSARRTGVTTELLRVFFRPLITQTCVGKVQIFAAVGILEASFLNAK